MNVLGSFFLGDAHHMRLQSSSTSPPLSPSPSLTIHRDGREQLGMTGMGLGGGMTNELALELRVRYLEAVIKGLKEDPRLYLEAKTKTNGVKDGGGDEGDDSTDEKEQLDGIGERGVTITRKIESIQERLDDLVGQNGNESLKSFLRHCTSSPHSLFLTTSTPTNSTDESSNAKYLTPQFALNDITSQPGTQAMDIGSLMSPSEFAVYIKDLAPDIRQAERDLREIDALEKRGVSAAGVLGSESYCLIFIFIHLHSFRSFFSPLARTSSRA